MSSIENVAAGIDKALDKQSDGKKKTGILAKLFGGSS